MRLRIAKFILNAWARHGSKLFWIGVGDAIGRYDTTGHFTSLPAIWMGSAVAIGIALLLLLHALHMWVFKQEWRAKRGSC